MLLDNSFEAEFMAGPLPRGAPRFAASSEFFD